MSIVELDFFAMDNRSLNSDSNPTLFRRHRSFKDIQGAISKINPEILKSLIASGSTEHSSDFATPIPQKFPPLSLHRTPNVDQNLSTPPPVYSATTSRMSPVIASEKYPLTIFYNETVSVFHVSRDEAKNIMRFAEKASGTGSGIGKSEAEKGQPMAEITSNQNQQPVAIDPENDEDLPLARKRSLQRFLERRKERVMSRAPTMATVTAALERSLQNCSLSHRQAAPPVPSDSHGGSSTHHLHLNSHLSLPYHWEQCLDLKTGEIYYINWRNGMKAKEDPRFTTEDDQYSDDYYCYSDDDDDDDDDSSYDSEESSTESSNNKNKNKNMEEQQEEEVLVVAGCKRCLMYFMVPKHLEECPKCSSGELLHFDRSENDIP